MTQIQANNPYTARSRRNIKQGVLFAGFLRLIQSRKFWHAALQVAFLLTLALIAFVGCSQKGVINKVYVPQKCEVSKKPRPLYTGLVVQDLKQTLIYTELLEQDLALCRGEKKDNDE